MRVRHALPLLALALSVSTPASAQQRLEEVFYAGRDAYERGEPETAIARWEALVGAGVDDADVYYDLGTAYAEEGRFAYAALAFERALRVAPGDAGAAAALEQTQIALAEREARRAGEAEFASEPHLAGALFRPIDEDLLAALVLVAELIALVSLLLWWRRREHLGALVVGVVALVIMLTAGVGVATKRGLFDAGPRALVLEDLHFRAGPAPDASEEEPVPAGALGFIIARERVGATPAVLLELPSGQRGWLPAASVGEI